MKQYVITWFLLAWMTMIHAQRTCVVADMESRKPIRNALIMTDTHHAARTNLYGYFAMQYAFDSATVSHPSFHSTKIKRTALPDTIFLLKKLNLLQEVTIYGVDRQKASLAFMKKSAQEAGAANPPAPSASAAVNFDFASIKIVIQDSSIHFRFLIVLLKVTEANFLVDGIIIAVESLHYHIITKNLHFPVNG